jgi:hypothetical protein
MPEHRQVFCTVVSCDFNVAIPSRFQKQIRITEHGIGERLPTSPISRPQVSGATNKTWPCSPSINESRH